MQDDCLLELYRSLIPEAQAVFEALTAIETGTMEQIMQHGQLRTQATRKGVWGLASTGLIEYQLGRPVRLSANGQRLIRLLEVRGEQQPQ